MIIYYDYKLPLNEGDVQVRCTARALPTLFACAYLNCLKDHAPEAYDVSDQPLILVITRRKQFLLVTLTEGPVAL
jgi:hypothetical protein